MSRKSAKQAALESRPRIDKTKGLTLDQRVAVVEQLMSQHNIPATPEGGQVLSKHLIDLGYEPMMFYHACNIVRSRCREMRS